MLEITNKNYSNNYYKEVGFIPAKNFARFATVIITCREQPVYHIDNYIEYNDDTDVYIIADNRDSIPGIADCWKWKTGVYTLLREWWRHNKNKINHNNKIFYMEYDVLVKNTKITDEMFTDGMRTSRDFSYYNITNGNGPDPSISWENEPWWWGVDGDKLSYELKKVAAATITSMFWFSANALDKLLLTEWLEICKQDIICEITIPTILNYYNVPLYNWDDSLGFMRCHNLPITAETELNVIERIKSKQSGIYHPVRGSIEEVFR